MLLRIELSLLFISYISPVLVPPVNIHAPVVRAAFTNPFLSTCERVQQSWIIVDKFNLKLYDFAANGNSKARSFVRCRDELFVARTRKLSDSSCEKSFLVSHPTRAGRMNGLTKVKLNAFHHASEKKRENEKLSKSSQQWFIVPQLLTADVISE